MERLMIDLEKAVDAVPDGHARTEILDCYRLLRIYRMRQHLIALTFEANLYKRGHGLKTTEKEAKKAMSEAQLAHPMPDVEPLVNCSVRRLPEIAK